MKNAASTIFKLLSKEFPDAHCELNFKTPYELLVATVLSAQCTDVRVNLVTPALFKKYPDAKSLAKATSSSLQNLIHSTGFYVNKSKNLLGAAKLIVKEHGGEIPSTMEELIKLPGVGRKTANVILGNAYGISEGIVVDTHVKRIATRLGLTQSTTPEKIEDDLCKIFPKKEWFMISHLMVFLGRRICIARKPKCPECPLAKICPSRRDY